MRCKATCIRPAAGEAGAAAQIAQAAKSRANIQERGVAPVQKLGTTKRHEGQFSNLQPSVA